MDISLERKILNESVNPLLPFPTKASTGGIWLREPLIFRNGVFHYVHSFLDSWLEQSRIGSMDAADDASDELHLHQPQFMQVATYDKAEYPMDLSWLFARIRIYFSIRRSDTRERN